MDSAQLIFTYFPNLSTTQVAQIELLGELYADWNQKINVISRADIDFFYERHVLHSLALAKFISFKSETSVLDLGTGGGFPGIPLAILFPNVKFHLVDSINKKIKVVSEVSSALGLTNLTCEHGRVEQLQSKYDFVVTRAVAEFQMLVNWTRGKIKPNSFNEIKNGIIALKGGDLTEELAAFTKVRVIPISDYFSEPFFETKKIVYA
ncbi:MAG: 16S rRNA (guanine(527)-N(7))-methyltransferase RsmG [Bacteroidetes bacterium]|nr:16S rRNA (guanine(527)-N(7))-methyltransferase RsmG [Bacteroidota bacterium]